ncbi:MAG: hypothetical protein ACE141_03705 [Bryobacteraceae bacterium]
MTRPRPSPAKARHGCPALLAEPPQEVVSAAEMHENWMEATRYRNMEPLAEQKKEALRRPGGAA